MSTKDKAKSYLKNRKKAYGEQQQDTRADIKKIKDIATKWKEWARITPTYSPYSYGMQNNMSTRYFKFIVNQHDILKEALEDVMEIFKQRLRADYINNPREKHYAIETYGRFLDDDIANDVEKERQLIRDRIAASKEQAQQASQSLIVEMREFKPVEQK